jgi:hypothetical protein
MRVRKASSAIAAIAVGGALVLGGCGGNDDSTAAQKANTMHDEGAMHDQSDGHGDAMKDDHGGAMEGHGDAMKEP